MEERYVIRRTNRYDNTIDYYMGYGTWLRDIRAAQRYRFDITIPRFILQNVDLNVYDVDVVSDVKQIGTYLSPKDKKHTLKNYANNAVIILLLPVLLPVLLSPVLLFVSFFSPF